MEINSIEPFIGQTGVNRDFSGQGPSCSGLIGAGDPEDDEDEEEEKESDEDEDDEDEEGEEETWQVGEACEAVKL